MEWFFVYIGGLHSFVKNLINMARKKRFASPPNLPMDENGLIDFSKIEFPKIPLEAWNNIQSIDPILEDRKKLKDYNNNHR